MSQLIRASQYSGSGSFGVQYLLHRRFAVFGETGIAYSHSTTAGTTTLTGTSIGSTSRTWGTRPGVEIIFYF